jgi:hypothetical protein
MNGYARTLGQIVDRTRRLCNDAKGAVWTGQEVINAINQTCLNLVRDTGCLRESALVQLQADVNIYDLPADCLRLTRIRMHGRNGWIVLPKTITVDVDLLGGCKLGSGDPWNFYREFLAPNQILVSPTPKHGGSGFTRDADHGLIRQIRDADGNTVDLGDNLPLRGLRGLPIRMQGQGGVLRSVGSLEGNLQVNYLRAPAKLELPDQYPDAGFPEWLHKDLPYGAAIELLKYRRTKLARVKVQRFTAKWLMIQGELQSRVEYKGPLDNYSVRPM